MERKKYTSGQKFRLVQELLVKDNLSELSRKHGINSNLLSKWKKQFIEKGSLVFDTNTSTESLKLKKEIEKLERIIGKKEIELSLLKNFLESYDSLK
jgi:transposase